MEILKGFEVRTPGGVPKGGFQDPTGPAGVVLHQPLAAGPCPRSGGGFWKTPNPRDLGLPGRPRSGARVRRDAGSPSRPRSGDRAPARGVDVKPRPRRGPGTGSRISGGPRLVPSPPQAGESPLPGGPGRPQTSGRSPEPSGSRIRGSGPAGTGNGSPAPGGGPRRGCFTSTPRGGALRLVAGVHGEPLLGSRREGQSP